MRIFTVSGDPQGKARPRFVNGRVYTPQRTRDYEAEVRQAYMQTFKALNPIPGAVRLEVQADFRVPKSGKHQPASWCLKRPDADNIAKAVLDALNGIAFADDAQVCDVRVVKRWADESQVTVKVVPI